jgi:hypothetical protein
VFGTNAMFPTILARDTTSRSSSLAATDRSAESMRPLVETSRRDDGDEKGHGRRSPRRFPKATHARGRTRFTFCLPARERHQQLPSRGSDHPV